MAIRFIDITITPQITTVGQPVLIEILLSDNSWQTILESFASFQEIKDTKANWQEVKDY